MLTTALKRGLLQNRSDFSQIYVNLTQNMAKLNTIVGDLQEFVVALTDVTGFGLAGHLCEMLAPAGLSAKLFLKEIPILQAAQDIYNSY